MTTFYGVIRFALRPVTTTIPWAPNCFDWPAGMGRATSAEPSTFHGWRWVIVGADGRECDALPRSP